MKKSTKILVPALAVLALGMAASVTGTVAWYSVGAASTTKNVAVTGALNSATNEYSAGSITFKLAATVTNGTEVILTDDYGMTYYTSGSTNYLDVTKIGSFSQGSQYALLTLSLTAEVASGHSVSEALNGLVGGTLTSNFTVSGTQNSGFKCTAVAVNSDPTAPTQAASANSETSGYTEKVYTSSGSSKWVDERTATWANVAHSDQVYTVVASSVTGNVATLATYKYFVGLDGTVITDSTELTITPTLTGANGINFGA